MGRHLGWNPLAAPHIFLCLSESGAHSVLPAGCSPACWQERERWDLLILVSWGGCDKRSQSQWLEINVVSPVLGGQRSESRHWQAGLPLEAPGENPFLVSSNLLWLSVFLAVWLHPPSSLCFSSLPVFSLPPSREDA